MTAGIQLASTFRLRELEGRLAGAGPREAGRRVVAHRRAVGPGDHRPGPGDPPARSDPGRSVRDVPAPREGGHHARHPRPARLRRRAPGRPADGPGTAADGDRGRPGRSTRRRRRLARRRGRGQGLGPRPPGAPGRSPPRPPEAPRPEGAARWPAQRIAPRRQPHPRPA